MTQSAELESPGGIAANGKPLDIRERPRVGLRLSKRAVGIAMVPVFVAMAVVTYNVADRAAQQNEVAAKKAESGPVQSSMDAAQAILDDAPSAVPTVAVEPPALPSSAPVATTALPPPSASVQPKPTGPDPAEMELQRRMEEARQALKRAMESDTTPGSFQRASAVSPAAIPVAGAGGSMSGMPDLAQLAAQTGLGQKEQDQNLQAEKKAFLKEAKQLQTPYLQASVKPAMSPFELKTGAVIPALLVSGLNSDLPGEIIGQVSENVYDSATGAHLLIPQGSKIFGMYDSRVAYGQSRLLVAWARVVFPNGSTLELGGMGGMDKGGYSGLEDQVDNHYMRIFGSALMVSLFSAGIQLSQPEQNSGSLGYSNPSAGQTIAGAVGQNLGQLGIEMSRKNMQIQPTIEIRPGYRFNVMINKDVVFPGAYK